MQNVIKYLSLCIMLLLWGCGGDGSPHHQHHDVHIAPHGGTLVELGDHEFNLEFVHEEDTGSLGIYVLGPHAEKYLRISQPSISISLVTGEESQEIELQAVANELTKETVGDTSYFSAQSDWLKQQVFSGKIVSVDINGSIFADVSFDLGDSHEHHHHH